MDETTLCESRMEEKQGRSNLNESGAVAGWQPEWIVDIGHGCEVGITIDDGCFVVLCKDWWGNWRPSPHIPHQVVHFLDELAKNKH